MLYDLSFVWKLFESLLYKEQTKKTTFYLQGTIYAVDDATIFIKGFSYDGTAPDAFFWIGSTPMPNPDGIIVPYPEEYEGR